MVIKVGDPVHLGFQLWEGGETGEIYSVGASSYSIAGRLGATGTVIVVVPNDQGYDDVTMKKMSQQKALAAVADNPSLLTTAGTAPGGPHRTPGREDGLAPPWDGDGFGDVSDPDGDEPRRILNPDSPQTGQ